MNHLRKVTSQKIQEVIKENRPRFDGFGVNYLGDEANVKVDGWCEAHIRILLCRLSTYESTRSSMTIPLLYQIINQKCQGVFVDRTFLPPRKDTEIFMREQVPLMFGITSKRPAWDFDIIAISNAIIMENLNLPFLLWNSGIPLMSSERLEDKECPLILLGGTNVRNVEYLFGDLTGMNAGKYGEGRGGLVDAVILGAAEESLPKFVDLVRDMKGMGYGKWKILEAASKGFVDAGYLASTPIKNWQAVKGVYLPGWYKAEYGADKKLKSVKPNDSNVAAEIVESATADLSKEVPLIHDFVSYVGGNGVADLEVSRGCGCGTCSFCQENWTERPYMERKLGDLMNWYKQARINVGAQEAGVFSFNWTSHSHIYQLLQFLGDHFGKVSLISNRIDFVANNPDLIRVARKLGEGSWTAGIEGFSDRLRRFLNKNCSTEVIVKAVTDAMRVGYSEIKLFFIATGFEEKRDLVECGDLLERLVKARDEMGVSCFIRISVTPLFSKSFTPLQFQQVLPAMHVDENTLGPLVDRCRDLGIGFRTSAKRAEIGISNLLEQGDRRLTPLLVESSLTDGFVFYGNVRKEERGRWDTRLKEAGLSWDLYFREKSIEDVLPWDHLSFGVPKKYLWKRYLMAKEFEEEFPCLRMNFRNKTLCAGCGACQASGIQVQEVINRELGEKVNSEKITVRSRERKAQIRFKIRVDEEHRYVQKSVWSYVLARALMRTVPGVDEIYHKVLAQSSSVCSKDPNPYCGVDYTDLSLIEPFNGEGLDLGKMNQEVRGFKIESVKVYPSADSLLSSSGSALWKLYLPRTLCGTSENVLKAMIDFLNREKIMVKTKQATGKGVFKIVQKEVSKDDLIAVDVDFRELKEEGVLVRMFLGANLNPYSVLASMFEMQRFRFLPLAIECEEFFLSGRTEAGSGDGLFALACGGICQECGGVIEKDLMGEFRGGSCVRCKEFAVV